ncbi:MAG: hypothetical protein PVSMB9_03460 [Candidatus Dormibacteria bacterium]
MEVRREPPGPLAEGSEITQFREESGRREVTRYLVSAYAANQSLTLQSVGARPPSTIAYNLEEVEAGVKLTCAITVETRRLLRLVESRLRRDLDRRLGETLEAFRGVMDHA